MTKAQSKPAGEDATADGAAAPPAARKGGLALIAAIAVFAAAGAGAWMLAPGPKAVAEAGEAKPAKKTKPKAKAKDKSHGKKDKKGGHGGADEATGGPGLAVVEFGGGTYVELTPIIVSVRTPRRMRHLRVGLALKTADPADAATLVAEGYFLRDALNAYLRSVDPADFESPAGMALFKDHIRRRIAVVAPDVDLDAVLITEFLLS